jgi:hypothetical protein
MTYWLTLHGFYPSPHGDLRRQVRGVGEHDPHA